ncbi:isochorismatase family protein [Desulfovermiculus halophilus]|uniref:isochorismatase family protein n=1 Tax=Desulfovermiculus halophilus TaxID=339722 RepID=UPI0006842049|nr:isochorismatase family protein [Desulfovermiculus halophilus]
MRHDYVAIQEDSLLLIVDLQTSMLKAISGWDQVAKRTGQLIQAAKLLNIPILLTEQYAKGLGGTHPDIVNAIGHPRVFAKEHFSACLEPDFVPWVQSFGKQKIVVAGTEAHVCVLQTSLDLIQAGFQVHLTADAVASRLKENRDIAVSQLRQAGAVVTSAEIVIFEWAKRSNTDEFRAVLPIVK